MVYFKHSDEYPIDTMSRYSNLGYSLILQHQCYSQYNRINLLQYADDSCIIADGPASCQKLLDIVDRWLKWAHMKAKVPKCCCLVFRSSSSKPFDPKLSLSESSIAIPYVGTAQSNSLASRSLYLLTMLHPMS